MTVRSSVLCLLIANIAFMAPLLYCLAGVGIAIAYPIVLECVLDESEEVVAGIVIDKKWFRSPTLAWRQGALDQIFSVTEFDEINVQAERALTPQLQQQLNFNRLSGRMESKILFDHLLTPILTSRCDDQLSVDECKEKINNIDAESNYLCEPSASIEEVYCDRWRWNMNVQYQTDWHCRLAAAKF